MVSTDQPQKLMNITKIKAALAVAKPIAGGKVTLTPIAKVVTTTPKAPNVLWSNKVSIQVQKPLQIVASAQAAKAKATAIKTMPKGIDQIIGGIAGVALGQALQNPLLSPETNKKILIQSTEQGLSGGIGKVAGVIPAGLGGTVGYAIGGTSGITQGVTQGPIQTVTNTVNKEYVERITDTTNTISEGMDMFKGAGEFLSKYGIWIAVGVGAILLLPMLTNVFKGGKD